MTEKRNFRKPCHELNHCPYGWLAEYFPLRGKATNGQVVIEPIGDDESIRCGKYGHDCPVFYAGEQVTEELEEPPALVLKQGSDYILRDGHPSTWIEIGDLVVYIYTRKDGAPLDGVAVDLMELGDEDGKVLDSAIAFHKEKKGEQG